MTIFDSLKKGRGYRIFAESYLGRKLSDEEFSKIIDEWQTTSLPFGAFLRSKT